MFCHIIVTKILLLIVTRRNKIIGHNYGLLYRDVAFLPKEIYTRKALNGEFQDSPTVCIEIKVKQGYMMNDDNSNTITKCRFCYFQVSDDDAIIYTLMMFIAIFFSCLSFSI